MMDMQKLVAKDLDYIFSCLGGDLDAIESSRILITGGAGFLGHYFVQSLLHWNNTMPQRKPAKVVVHDNFIRGRPQWLDALEGRTDLEVTHRDISQPDEDAPRDLDYVIHAASIASPTFYRKHPIETMDANVQGLRHLLDLARAQAGQGIPLRAFLYLSSSEIYGDPDPAHIPTPETYNGNVSCTGPRACYDESKRYGESLSINFARQYGVPVRIVRPFNNYGPGLSITDGRVLPDFARDVLAGRDIVVFSDGSPTRTFCYVADAIVGYMKVLLRGRDGEVYNIGNDRPEISISELAELVRAAGARLFAYSGNIVHERSHDANYLVDNPNRRCPNIDKARTELGFEPSIDIEDGITRSLTWYKAAAKEEGLS